MDSKIYECCKEITKKTANLELKDKLSKFREFAAKQRDEISKIPGYNREADSCYYDLDQLVGASSCILSIVNHMESVAYNN